MIKIIVFVLCHWTAQVFFSSTIILGIRLAVLSISSGNQKNLASPTSIILTANYALGRYNEQRSLQVFYSFSCCGLAKMENNGLVIAFNTANFNRYKWTDQWTVIMKSGKYWKLFHMMLFSLKRVMFSKKGHTLACSQTD